MRKRMLILSALVALVTGVGVSGCASQTTASLAEPAPTITVTAAPSRSVTVDVVKQTTKQWGFDSSQVTVDKVNVSASNAVESGTGTFASSHINTATQLKAFLASKQGAPVIKQQMQATGATAAEVRDTQNWVSVQFWVPIGLPGNTYLSGSTVATSSRTDAKGTVMWVFVPPAQVKAGKVTSVGIMRAACGNPQTKPPTPPKPPTPTPTPSTSTCPPDKPHGHPPYCKDDPSHDPMNNPSVPAQVKGPGTGVTDPPSTPTDGPCGMTVCPTATPKPTPPSGGGPTTVPSPTQSAQTPSPIATQSSNPTPIPTPPPPAN